MTPRATPVAVDAPVRLWRISLTPHPGDDQHALLDDEDRARLPRMDRDVRARLLARRAVLRQVVATELAVVPASLALERIDGRLVVHTDDGRTARPSTSSSGDIGLVALADGPVGVDVEARAPVPEAADIARDLFHPDEVRWIGEGEGQLERFLAVWVRKEAVVKLSGEGLQRDLRTFRVAPGDAEERVSGEGLGRVATRGVAIEGTVAAVAWLT
ncbi:4'-phosphopantetheinyl transferase family protein [Actinomarinicola tropica]|uniref:4'-phosphopantetheinyl transferase superfamily protein n=1 Tax=Actinomarinicola tropica TaxID=2789776 RepID=A0A5Q2RGK5_9ACTN|nr:4'-phosphopantetheinyl transferase superfamily protein [Actinomarinicola tropica]QGG94764.1 4'-phosphopantetheinyl transferase superfamily protein [Actinomarinicola tropica]